MTSKVKTRIRLGREDEHSAISINSQLGQVRAYRWQVPEEVALSVACAAGEWKTHGAIKREEKNTEK